MYLDLVFIGDAYVVEFHQLHVSVNGNIVVFRFEKIFSKLNQNISLWSKTIENYVKISSRR